MDQRLPGAKWMPVSYRAEAGTFTAHPLGYIVHVVVGNGSPFGIFQNAKSPDRRFAHAWVAKDGRSEQYAELTLKSWAQKDGNPFYWSFETEGFPGEPLTAAQINTLATWHNFLGAPDRLANAPGQTGSGTHAMGGAAYGGHTCPGPGPRAAQRWDIILRARQLRSAPVPITPTPPEVDMPLTDAEIHAIAADVWNRFKIRGPGGEMVSLADTLARLLASTTTKG